MPPPLPPAITSRANAKVKALRASLSGEARRAGDLLGIEGWTLVREAHAAGCRFEAVYLRADSDAGQREYWQNALETESWVVLSPEVFDSAVSTVTPQGIAAIWRIQDPVPRPSTVRCTLVLENLQDPGNLGTLMRSAVAFGVEDIVVTPDSVNQWNPKVVRSAASASFRVRVRRLPLAQAVEELRVKNTRVFAAVSSFLSGPGYGTPVTRWTAAAAQEPAAYCASSSWDAEFLEPCAVMIGNEGAGLSLEARKLADEQVKIPCSVESLNAAVAGSILLYEVMRQQGLRTRANEPGMRT